MDDIFADFNDTDAMTAAFASLATDYDPNPFYLDVIDYNHACRH